MPKIQRAARQGNDVDDIETLIKFKCQRAQDQNELVSRLQALGYDQADITVAFARLVMQGHILIRGNQGNGQIR